MNFKVFINFEKKHLIQEDLLVIPYKILLKLVGRPYAGKWLKGHQPKPFIKKIVHLKGDSKKKPPKSLICSKS